MQRENCKLNMNFAKPVDTHAYIGVSIRDTQNNLCSAVII